VNTDDDVAGVQRVAGSQGEGPLRVGHSVEIDISPVGLD
jgi:hypothetical protein